MMICSYCGEKYDPWDDDDWKQHGVFDGATGIPNCITSLRAELDEAKRQVGDLIDTAADKDPRGRVWVLVTLAELAAKDKRIEELERLARLYSDGDQLGAYQLSVRLGLEETEVE